MRDVLFDLLTGTVIGLIIWFGIPRLLATLGREANRATRRWLVGAIACVFVSYFLPSPWFANETDTFSQHLVGGGVSSALIGYYLIGHFALASRFHRGLLILAVVSILGVANEMFELATDIAYGGGVVVDASWDLLANNVGAALTYAVVELAGRPLGEFASEASDQGPDTPVGG